MKRDLISYLSMILLATAALTLGACGGTKSDADETALEHNHEGHEAMSQDQSAMSSVPMSSFNAPAPFKSELGNLYEDYQTLKDALVATDAEQAALGTTSMQQTLSSIDASGLEGEARSYWNKRAEKMDAALAQMHAGGNVETIRKGFADLTVPMQEAIAGFGANTRKLYVQHCPMAFNNTGASWLSDKEQVSNPYFGDKMLRCGSVEATIDLP